MGQELALLWPYLGTSRLKWEDGMGVFAHSSDSVLEEPGAGCL